MTDAPPPADPLQRRRHLAQLREQLGLAVAHVEMAADDRLRIVLSDDVGPDALPGLRAAAAAAPGAAPVPPPLNIVMLVVGSRGDVQPFIPIAKRLMRDGHRVRLATHACFRDFVESHGVEFFPLGGDPKELMAYMVMTGGKLIPTSVRQIVEEVPKKRQMVGEIVASTWSACTQPDPERPDAPPFVADAIIANPPSYGHLHCAEALHVPLHIMFTMPWTPTTAVPHPFAAHATEDAARCGTGCRSPPSSCCPGSAWPT